MKSIGLVRTTLLIFVLTLAGCSGLRTNQLLPAAYTEAKTDQSSELTIDQEAQLEWLCPFGAPVLGEYYRREPITRIVRGGYAMDHYDRLKTPIWVCERLTLDHVHGPMSGRAASWKPDPVLCPSGSNTRCERGAVDADYRNSGYDRGHLAPNMNQRLDEGQKNETFYFSNAAPQVGKGFNQSIWKALEETVADWVKELGQLWTITGVLYYEEAEDDPATADGYVIVPTIGTGSVYVPTHFYKVVVWQVEDQVDGFAVVMENRVHAQGESFRDEVHLQPIRWVERRLDVDFMPNLEPFQADELEEVTGRPFL